MLIYNLAVMKNSKIKMYTQDEAEKAEKLCQDYANSSWASLERELKQVLKS